MDLQFPFLSAIDFFRPRIGKLSFPANLQAKDLFLQFGVTVRRGYNGAMATVTLW